MKFSYFLFPSLLLFTQLGHGETLSDALLKCANEKNSLKRLVCYDQLSDSYTQYQDVPLSTIQRVQTTQNFEPQTNQPSRSQPQALPQKDQFGLPSRKNEGDKDKKRYMTVKKIARTAKSRLILTMENDQVWRQNDDVNFKVEVGEQIYVERGAIGSYWLSKDSVKRRIRIKRIK